MGSKTHKQARTMAGAAHDQEYAKRMGIPQKVAREYNRRDAKSGMIGRAMKKRTRKGA
jgi:hypothetical protein